MFMAEIDQAERHEGGQGNQGIESFESQVADSAYHVGTHSDGRAEDVWAAEQEPPDENEYDIFHKSLDTGCWTEDNDQ